MCQLSLDYLWGPHEVTKVSEAERRKKSQGGRGSGEGKPLGDDAMAGLKMEERGPQSQGMQAGCRNCVQSAAEQSVEFPEGRQPHRILILAQ